MKTQLCLPLLLALLFGAKRHLRFLDVRGRGPNRRLKLTRLMRSSWKRSVQLFKVLFDSTAVGGRAA